jgi:type IV pilus assembly protein PilW
MQSFEGQKRTSTGGNDAQTNGAVALYLLEQEVRMAGYGLFGPEGAFCRKGINIYKDNGAQGEVTMNAASLVPARIVDGGSSADSIVVMRSRGTGDALPLAIKKTMPNPSSIVTVGSDGGLKVGDLFIVGAREGNKVCTLMQLSQPPQGTHKDDELVNLNHNSGNGSPYNPSNIDQAFTNTEAYVAEDIVFRVGDRGPGRRFSVRCDHLVESSPVDVGDNAVTCVNSTPMVAQVVDLQAQYGVVNGGVLSWENATGALAALDDDEVDRIRAIRVGVVVRHPQYEKAALPAPPVPAWMGEATNNAIAANANYRHRVFETVIPLRNVIWAP